MHRAIIPKALNIVKMAGRNPIAQAVAYSSHAHRDEIMADWPPESIFTYES